MSKEKELNLKLFYKGKNLDTVKEQRDIKSKWVIGSDKFLHWQILDRNFPKKHTLVKRTRDRFKIILRQGMRISKIRYGDQELDENDLKNKRLLRKNQLLIDSNMQGRIDFAGDWSVAFEHTKPFRRVITPEEKRMIQEYHKFPELTPQQKLTRNLFSIAILMLLIFGFLFERFYEPPVVERSLRPLAQRVDVTPVETDMEFEVTPPTATPTDEGVVEEGPPRDIAGILGFDPGDVSEAEAPTSDLTLVTRSEDIVTAAEREAVGPGDGRGPRRPRGGRGEEVFDPGDTAPRQPAGTLLRGDFDAERYGVRPVDESLLEGRTDLEVTHISTAEQLAAISRARRRAAEAGLQPVAEEDIEEAAPQVRATIANIRQYVDVYWRQVEELFHEERRRRNMHGSMVITLYFDANGNVEAADIQPRPGSQFTDEFVSRARQLMMQWRIPATEQMQPYQFTRRFMRI